MTQVNNYTAILSGDTWNGRDVMNQPVFVTYSFETAVQPYVNTDLTTQGVIDSFRTFTTSEKVNTRAALQQWADASGIIFLEVKAGKGDIKFGSFDFSQDPDIASFTGYAYYPITGIVTDFGYSYRDGLGGDVFIDHGDATSRYLLLHEIGHALGFKHPFDGDPTLPPSLDNHAHTVMSYTGNYPGTLGTFDVQAVAAVYGAAGSGGTQVAAWNWNATALVLTQDGFETDETIFGVSVRDVMNGNGGSDVMGGFQGRDTLSGGDGNDQIFGGDGDDTLRGGKGQDDLYGEAGNDRFDFNLLATGNDIVHWFSNDVDDNDVLRFRASVFGDWGHGTNGLGYLDKVHFQSSFSAVATNADIRFIYHKGTGVLWFDSDGTGAAAAVKVATFDSFPILTAGDILLY